MITRSAVASVMAVLAALIGIATLIWPTWWESLIGESPDGGDGSLERLVALVWIAVAAGLALLARRDRRRRALQTRLTSGPLGASGQDHGLH